MNKKNIEKFLNNQFQIYKIKNFNSMIDYCYSYGCKNSEYENDISKITNYVFNSIISKIINNNIKYSYKDSSLNIKINISHNIKNYMTTHAKLYVPIDVVSFFDISNLLIDFIIENKINCNIKLSKINMNDLLVLTIYDYNLVNRIIEYLNNSIEWKKAKKIKNIPLIPIINDIGICTDIYPYNYIDTFNNLLCLYFTSTIKHINEIKVDDFIQFLTKHLEKEKRYLRKYIINIIINSIDIIVNNKDPLSVFNYNSNMNIGNKNIDTYKLLIDNNRMIYFQDKAQTHNILFNSPEYLSLCYAKYYENIIQKNSELEYYAFFRSTYIRIVQNNFKDIEKLLDFSYLNKDDIYTKLAIISFIYFAIEKMGLPYKDGYEILKKILERKYNIKFDIVKETKIEEEKFEFPFENEYKNKVITLKNGKITTIYEFFKENNVIKSIPLNCTLHLNDGRTILSDEFLKNIYKIINNYNNINEIIDDYILLIEFNWQYNFSKL